MNVVILFTGGSWKLIFKINETNIYDDARIYEDAEVYENAMICGNAEIYGNTKVYGKAKIIYNFEEQLNNITNIN